MQIFYLIVSGFIRISYLVQVIKRTFTRLYFTGIFTENDNRRFQNNFACKFFGRSSLILLAT